MGLAAAGVPVHARRRHRGARLLSGMRPSGLNTADCKAAASARDVRHLPHERRRARAADPREGTVRTRRRRRAPRADRARESGVNAIVTLVAEQAMERARAADESWRTARGVGPLHGLPIAHKDLQSTTGIRTTFGSPILRGLRAVRGFAARRAPPARRRDHSSARRTRRSSAPARRRSTRCSARR